MCVICIVAENAKNVKFNRKKRGQTMPVRCVHNSNYTVGATIGRPPVQCVNGRPMVAPTGQGCAFSPSPTQKKPSLRKAFFVWIYFARVRYRKVTISARVQIRFGLNVVPLVPMVISLPTAQITAFA